MFFELSEHFNFCKLLLTIETQCVMPTFLTLFPDCIWRSHVQSSYSLWRHLPNEATNCEVCHQDQHEWRSFQRRGSSLSLSQVISKLLHLNFEIILTLCCYLPSVTKAAPPRKTGILEKRSVIFWRNCEDWWRQKITANCHNPPREQRIESSPLLTKVSFNNTAHF